jgi:hypothetical protein
MAELATSLESDTLKGRVVAVMIADREDTLESKRVELGIMTTFEGFPGDRHAGHTRRAGVRERKYYPKGTIIKNNRQVSIVSSEELAQVAQTMGIAEIQPEWLGANLCIDGIPNFTQLAGLTRFVFPSGATIIVYGENTPCINPGQVIAQYNEKAFAPNFPKAAMHRRGLVGWIECPGEIREGDEVIVQIPE